MARRKSIFDRYTYDQLQRFRDEYRREFEMGETNRGRAAASAGLRNLFTVTDWNSPSAAALFDDALACAARIDFGFFLHEQS